jgi:Ca-activated chloride channel family protein
MHNVSKIIPIGCLMIAVLCLAPKYSPNAQEPVSQVVKPSGPRVELSLIVTDKGNKSLGTIRKDEIRVVEDNVEQSILSVDADERPVDCALLIDASGSFRKLLVPALEAAKLIVLNRRPADEMFIARFISSDKIERLQDFTTDGNALIDSLKSFKIEGGQSAVIDALYMAADHVAKHKSSEPRRKVLVIITDGEDRNSFYKTESLVKLLREQRVQVFALGLTSELSREAGTNLVRLSPREKAEKLLQTVTEESGGRVLFPQTNAELMNSISQIIGDLRAQFRITYQSSNDTSKKGFRKVEVKLNSNGQKRIAIVPRGYYVPSKSLP